MNCLDCEYHQVIRDPDPNDWFCSDDLAVVCSLTPNPRRNTQSRWSSDHSPFRIVALSCRPHYLKKESITPSWCPILGAENGQTKET